MHIFSVLFPQFQHADQVIGQLTRQLSVVESEQDKTSSQAARLMAAKEAALNKECAKVKKLERDLKATEEALRSIEAKFMAAVTEVAQLKSQLKLKDESMAKLQREKGTKTIY